MMSCSGQKDAPARTVTKHSTGQTDDPAHAKTDAPAQAK